MLIPSESAALGTLESVAGPIQRPTTSGSVNDSVVNGGNGKQDDSGESAHDGEWSPDTIDSTHDAFPECEQFLDDPLRYATCRHERLTPEKCDRWRINRGLAPLNPDNATTAPPAHAIARTGQGGIVRGWAGKRAAGEAARATGSPARHKAKVAEPPLPSLAARAANVANAAARYAKAGAPSLCTEDQIAARLAICEACPLYRASDQKCAKCGCGCGGRRTLLNKLALPTECCPDNPPRWDALVVS